MSKPQNCNFPGKNLTGFLASICVSVVLFGAVGASAQEKDLWHLDPVHSSAPVFRAPAALRISTLRGTFDKLSGEVKYDAANPAAASIDVTIDANSVDTRVSMRDNDLRSDHFLDVAKYPDHHL